MKRLVDRLTFLISCLNCFILLLTCFILLLPLFDFVAYMFYVVASWAMWFVGEGVHHGEEKGCSRAISSNKQMWAKCSCSISCMDVRTDKRKVDPQLLLCD